MRRGVCGQAKHQVREGRTRKRAGQLRDHVWKSAAPGLLAQRCCEGDHRIEVRAGHGSEREDERDQRAACRDRVHKQRESNVAATEPLGHDA